MPLEVECHLSASSPICTDLRVLSDGSHRRSEKTNKHFRVGLPNLFPRVLEGGSPSAGPPPGWAVRLEVGEIRSSGTPIFSSCCGPFLHPTQRDLASPVLTQCASFPCFSRPSQPVNVLPNSWSATLNEEPRPQSSQQTQLYVPCHQDPRPTKIYPHRLVDSS